MPPRTMPKLVWFSFQRATAWSTYSTKIRPTNSVKRKRSRRNSVLKRWASIPRRTIYFWIPRTLVRHRPPPQTGRTPIARRFKARFTSSSTDADGATGSPRPLLLGELFFEFAGQLVDVGGLAKPLNLLV